MKAVIKFKNQSGETEYFGRECTYVPHLIDAQLYDYDEDASEKIAQMERPWAPAIWKTAAVQLVKLVEV